MLQLIRSVLDKEVEAPLTPETRLTLLFQNREPKDVLLADDLDALTGIIWVCPADLICILN